MAFLRIAAALLAALLFFGSARGQESERARDPETNFEYAWKILDRNYAQFDSKHVDWDALYRVYRPQVTAKTTDAVIETFAGADAMILDVRHNPGGNGSVANSVACRFADRKRHFMKSQVRYGTKHDDFGPVAYWNVGPLGPVQFKEPTLVLTNRSTESAADVFVLAMRVLPHVTVVGDFTAGAFSSQFPEKLPRGTGISKPPSSFSRRTWRCIHNPGTSTTV